MPSFNKITIVGHLGRDPELRYTPSGQAVAQFTVATSEKRKDKDDVTTWFRVAVWGKSAEAANTYLKKGSAVYVEGRLRLDEYTDKEGKTRQTLEVSATEVQFLGGREDKPAASAAAAEVQRPASRPRAVEADAEVFDDGVPF